MKASESRNERPCLVVSLSGGESRSYPIEGREVTIGRDPSNDICLLDPLVSKFHAKLLVANQSVTVVDLSSVNKTRVNGQLVTHATVRYGDDIQFARVRCRLLLSGSPLPMSDRDRDRDRLRDRDGREGEGDGEGDARSEVDSDTDPEREGQGLPV